MVFFVPGLFCSMCSFLSTPTIGTIFNQKKVSEFCGTFGSDCFGLEGVTKGPPTSAKNSATPGRVEESRKVVGLFWGDPFFVCFLIDWNHTGVSKNRGFSPQIIHFNRVFHYFHHPFWGKHPYFWKHPYQKNDRIDVWGSLPTIAQPWGCFLCISGIILCLGLWGL